MHVVDRADLLSTPDRRSDMTRVRAERRRAFGLAGVASILAGGFLAVTGFTTPVSAASVEPVDFTADGNPTCAMVLAPASPVYQFKIDAQPADGTYPFSEGESGVPGGGSVTISNAGVSGGVFEFDWSSTAAWDAVIVKQGNGAAVYYYDPARSEDTDLHPSTTNGQPTGGISHVTFCRDGAEPSTTEPPTTEPPTTEPPTTEPPTTEGDGPTTSVLGVVVERPAPQGPAPAAAPAAQAQQLPRTGEEDLTLALVGLGLILLGGGAVLLSRDAASA